MLLREGVKLMVSSRPVASRLACVPKVPRGLASHVRLRHRGTLSERQFPHSQAAAAGPITAHVIFTKGPVSSWQRRGEGIDSSCRKLSNLPPLQFPSTLLHRPFLPAIAAHSPARTRLSPCSNHGPAPLPPSRAHALFPHRQCALNHRP